jgi:hypothetical protein
MNNCLVKLTIENECLEGERGINDQCQWESERKKRRENQEESCIVIHLQQSKTTRSVRISINLSNASLAQKKKVVKKKEVKKKGRM